LVIDKEFDRKDNLIGLPGGIPDSREKVFPFQERMSARTSS